MQKPKISVIIPIYNVEKYLKQCLDSVIEQTFSDIEIICVNDGSTDNSAKILEEYKNKDSRIIVIHKKNKGLSSARNAGMKIAKGEFFSFIDSDDWIHETMLEKLFNDITNKNTDISICAVNLFDETKQKITNPEPYFSLEPFDSTFDNRVFSYEDTKSFIMDIGVMAWNKLYRKTFLDLCNAKFPEGIIWEDGPFFFSIFFKTKKVSLVREFLYFYRINRKGSIVQKGGKKFIDIIDMVNLMYENLKKTSVFEDVKYDFFKQKADDIIYRYEFVSLKHKYKFAKRFTKKSCLLDESVFDFDYIRRNMPKTYREFCLLKNKSNIIYYCYRRLLVRIMDKIMQILYAEENVYYFKFKRLKLRIKKRPDLYNFWYKRDKIYIKLFKKIKFSIPFKYSELEIFY